MESKALAISSFIGIELVPHQHRSRWDWQSRQQAFCSKLCYNEARKVSYVPRKVCSTGSLPFRSKGIHVYS